MNNIKNKLVCIQIGNLSGNKWDKIYEIARRVYSPNGIAPTIHTCGGGNLEPKIIVERCCEKIKT